MPLVPPEKRVPHPSRAGVPGERICSLGWQSDGWVIVATRRPPLLYFSPIRCSPMSDASIPAQPPSPLFTSTEWGLGIISALIFAGLLYAACHEQRPQDFYFPIIIIPYSLLILYYRIRRHYRPNALPETLSTDSPLIRKLSRIRKYLFIAAAVILPLFWAISWLALCTEAYLGGTHPLLVQKIAIVKNIVSMEHNYWFAFFYSAMAVVSVLGAYINERTTVATERWPNTQTSAI